MGLASPPVLGVATGLGTITAQALPCTPRHAVNKGQVQQVLCDAPLGLVLLWGSWRYAAALRCDLRRLRASNSMVKRLRLWTRE